MKAVGGRDGQKTRPPLTRAEVGGALSSLSTELMIISFEALRTSSGQVSRVGLNVRQDRQKRRNKRQARAREEDTPPLSPSPPNLPITPPSRPERKRAEGKQTPSNPSVQPAE